MTLTEALDALHRAGRIRSPWLPGMRYLDPWTDRRIVSLTAEGTPAWGVAGTVVMGRDSRAALLVCEPSIVAEPDLTDPATVGCLAALAREASGRTLLTLDVQRPHNDHGVTPGAGTRWCVWDPATDAEWPLAPTEGEAWAACLVALAEEVTRGE